MEVDSFMAMCGHSIWAEEYRGDLRMACDEIETSMLEGPPEDPEQAATLLYCNIILSSLVGRLNVAYNTLNQLHALLGRLAPEWGLRYTSCKTLVDYTRRYPPCIRFRHESMMPMNLPMLSDIAGPTDMTTELLENFKRYVSSGTALDQSRCLLLQNIVNFPVQLRYLATTLHPQYPDGDWKVKNSPLSPEEAITEKAPSLVQFKELAQATDAGAIALYLERLLLEAHYSINSSSSGSVSNALYSAYEKAGDKAGMANCKLLEGDNNLSPPFASPLTYNIIPIDTASAGGESNMWDPVEARTPFNQSDQASECYDAALNLFEESGSPRGQAAVLLRQGCSLHARACTLDTQDPARYGAIDEADEKFQRSLAMFEVDESNAQIVKAHQILLDINRGNLTADVRKRAGDIGKWGREAKNELVSHFVGLLMLRFARREWERYSRFDAAVFCYECAYECSMQLGDIVPAFQSLVARASMHHDLFNYSGARIATEQCLSMFDSIVQYYEDRIAACPGTPIGAVDRQQIMTKKFDFIWTFGYEVGMIYSRTEDLDNFEQWQEKFLHFIEHDECFEMMRDIMRNREDLVKSILPRAYHGQRLNTAWETAMSDQKATEKYRRAEISFLQAILNGDLQKGEDCIRRLLDELSVLDAEYTRDLCRIMACQRLGDVRKAREILDSLSDQVLFNGRMDEFAEGIGIDTYLPDIADNAVYACVIAQDWKRGSRVLNAVLKFSPAYLEDAATDTAVSLTTRVGSASLVAIHNDLPELAFRRLLQARRLIELRRRQTTDIDARVGSLAVARNVENFVSLAELCLRCAETELPVAILSAYDHGHTPAASWKEHALLFLEEGRARAILDSLQASAASESEKMSEIIYKRRARTHLQSLSSRTPQQEQELRQLETDMDALERDNLSSSENALIQTVDSNVDPQSLFHHINTDTVVIEATFYRYGSISLAVTNKGIESCYRSSVRDVDIRRPTMEYMRIMRSMTGLKGDAEQQRKGRLEILSAQISDVLLIPFANLIRSKAHVIFSVSQPLAAFPFSALLFDGQPLIVHAAVSQTPSLTVLYYLSRRQATSSTPTVSVFTKGAKSQSDSSQSQNTGETYLAMAGIEAVNIAHMFATWPIEASNLSRAEFRDYIKGQASVLHIGTHGNLDPHNPLLSSISIGEDFRVLDMSQIRSNANLLVLAACLSGLGKTTVGNDVLGFTHVVLGTGCQAYIGTLWEVSDFASMLLMILFYRNLKSEPALSLANALRRAQVTLFTMDDAGAGRFFDDLLETWGSIDQEGQSPADIVPEGRYLLALQKMLLPQLDWTDPFFWAPFMLMGYGDFCFSSGNISSN